MELCNAVNFEVELRPTESLGFFGCSLAHCIVLSLPPVSAENRMADPRGVAPFLDLLPSDLKHHIVFERTTVHYAQRELGVFRLSDFDPKALYLTLSWLMYGELASRLETVRFFVSGNYVNRVLLHTCHDKTVRDNPNLGEHPRVQIISVPHTCTVLEQQTMAAVQRLCTTLGAPFQIENCCPQHDDILPPVSNLVGGQRTMCDGDLLRDNIVFPCCIHDCAWYPSERPVAHPDSDTDRRFQDQGN